MKIILSVAFVVVALAGCAASPDRSTPTPVVLRSFDRQPFVFSADGQPTAWSSMISQCASADVVVLAEQHGHPAGLEYAAMIWEAMLSNKGNWKLGSNEPPNKSKPMNPALALEFFERDDQSRIDDYLAGLSTEEVFLKRTGKALPPGADPWASGYPPGHRDMVEAAKKAGVPVYAANAPRAYVRLARTKGYGALNTLTPEQQRLVVLPRFAADGNRPDNRYWRDFLSFMDSAPEKYAAASAEEREKVDSMFRAQSIWDATMADSVRQALARGHAPVFLVIGQFHADFAADGGGGTVQALKAARPGTKVVVVSFQDANPNGGFRAEDKGRADFVVYVGARPEQPAK
jgi:uncharacterized iron-regulated protein